MDLSKIYIKMCEEAREIQRITGIQTIAAKDGLLVSPQNYGNHPVSPIKGYYWKKGREEKNYLLFWE